MIIKPEMVGPSLRFLKLVALKTDLYMIVVVDSINLYDIHSKDDS